MYNPNQRRTRNAAVVFLHKSTQDAQQNWVTTDSTLSDVTQSCTTPVISGDAGYTTYTCTPVDLNEVFYQTTCVVGNGRCDLTPHQVTSGNGALGQNSTVGGIGGSGRYVTYSTADATVSGINLGYNMVFVYDTCYGASGSCTPQSVPVCLSAQGAIADSDCTGGQISDDGLYILIYSSADNLIDGVYGASYIVSNPLVPVP